MTMFYLSAGFLSGTKFAIFVRYIYDNAFS